MKSRKKRGVAGALAIIGLTGILCPTWAEEVIVARLTASPDGGMHASVAMKVALSETKPAGIIKEPVYLRTPKYGTIMLGDAKNNRIVVALDAAPNSARPRLYVDTNGNGDLTLERPIELVSLSTASAKPGTPAAGIGYHLGGRALVNARYKDASGVKALPSGLTFDLTANELTYNRDYSREGKLMIGARSYRVALIDMGLDGRYADYKHADGQAPKVVLLIDRNGNGAFEIPAEAYDLAKPFRLGTSSYEVASVDNKGTLIAVKKSAFTARETITAADLRVGGDSISFDAETLNGKKVSFAGDYKGKIVLLDFWATWNMAYRDEVTGIVQVYNQYHPEGFDILGISLDKPGAKQMLAEFTQQAGMMWPEVYDGGSFDAAVAHLYGVQQIPYAVLVDGDTGKILAMGKTLRGAGLEAAVANALANKKK